MYWLLSSFNQIWEDCSCRLREHNLEQLFLEIIRICVQFPKLKNLKICLQNIVVTEKFWSKKQKIKTSTALAKKFLDQLISLSVGNCCEISGAYLGELWGLAPGVTKGAPKKEERKGKGKKREKKRERKGKRKKRGTRKKIDRKANQHDERGTIQVHQRRKLLGRQINREATFFNFAPGRQN